MSGPRERETGFAENYGLHPCNSRVNGEGPGAMVHGVPEFHRRAADDAAERREQAREQLAASQRVIDELDALLDEADAFFLT